MGQNDYLHRIVESFKIDGGKFYISPERMRDALSNVRGFVFDWDGVFNNGYKGGGYEGVFSESDSMGTNLLRYGYWLKNGKLPYIAIITGQPNITAMKFAKREHYTAVYQNINDKKQAIEHACHIANMKPNQIACISDDVNDLSMSLICGLRIQVKRSASPLFAHYTANHSLCDYVTGHSGDRYAVREICELFLGLSGMYVQTIESRISFDEKYLSYYRTRNEYETNYYTGEDGLITLVEEKN